MKTHILKSIIIPVFLFMFGFSFAQVPQSFNYQAIVRDAGGDPLVNTEVTIAVLLSNSLSQSYAETHTMNTNDYGLVSFKIGQQNAASFAMFNWTDTDPVVTISVDGDVIGSEAFQSVPYALEAGNVATGGDGLTKVGNVINLGGATNSSIAIDMNGQDFEIVDANEVRLDASLFYINNGSSTPLEISNDRVNLGSVTYPVELVIKDGNQALGKVLTSNASGQATWQTPVTSPWTESGVDISSNNTGNVIIGSVLSGSPEKLSIGGSVLTTGDYKYTTAKTHYQSYPWCSFVSMFPGTYLFGQTGTTGNRYGEFVSGGTAFGYALSPINLPDGAIVTGITGWVYDNVSTTPVRVEFIRQGLGATTSTILMSVESSVANASTLIQELSDTGAVTIDNANNTYYLRFTGSQNDSNTRFYNARITYTVTQAD